MKSLQTDGYTDRQIDRQMGKDGQMDRQTDDEQQVIREAHLNLWFRCAKTDTIMLYWILLNVYRHAVTVSEKKIKQTDGKTVRMINL